jgi:hypothetical protein
LFIFLLTCIGHFSNVSPSSLPKTIEYNCDSLPNHLLIVNAFDAMALHLRNNKKELFRDLADSLKSYLYHDIIYRDEGQPVIFADLLTGASATDSAIIRLMAQNGASKSIVIRSLNVFFDQTGVEVTGEKGSKNRAASYNICSNVTYDIYSNADTMRIESSKTSVCEFFTTRNVLSGFLAAGPDVVGKKKFTFSIVSKNASKYLTDIEAELLSR